MRKLYWTILLFGMILLVGLLASAETVYNGLTVGQGDSRYCKLADGCGGSSSGGNDSFWNRTGTNTYLANINDNVGIGTTSPGNQLTLAAENLPTDGISLTASSYTNILNPGNISNSVVLNPRGFSFQADSVGVASNWMPTYGIFLGMNRPRSLVINNTGGDAITVLNGNVAIGQVIASDKLEVKGNIRQTWADSSSYVYYDASYNGGWREVTAARRMEIFSNSGDAGNGHISLLPNTNGGMVGIGTQSPSGGFVDIEGNISGIGLYVRANISVGGLIYHSEVFDKSKGRALSKIKDSDSYKFANGSINHKAFEDCYVETKYTIVDHYVRNYAESNNESPYYWKPVYINKTDEGYNAECFMQKHEQAIYELKQEKDNQIANLTEEIKQIKDKLKI